MTQQQEAPQPDLSILSRRRDAEAAPNVPSPHARWKTRVLVPVALLLSVAALVFWSARDSLLPAAEVRVVPVMLRPAGAGDVMVVRADRVVAQAPGWVEADPYPIYVPALAAGTIEKILVLEDSPVTVHQPVAHLVADDARLAQAHAVAELSAREAALKLAQATARAAQRDWDHPIERERAVATARAHLDAAKASLARLPDQIAAEKAKRAELADEYARIQRSIVDEVATELELARAKFRHEGQAATLRATERQRPVLEAEVRRLEAELSAAQQNLELRIPETKALAEARAAAEQARALRDRAKAARDEARLRLDRMVVRSPAAGVVMQRLKAPGDKVMPGGDNPGSAHVLSLYDPQKLQVRVDVPLADASQVFPGQRARLVVDVLPDRTFTGHVTRIVREADIQKNTQQVKVAIEDPSTFLAPEMLARVKFLARAPTAAAATRPATGEAGNTLLFVPEEFVARDNSDDTSGRVWLADATSRTVTAAEVKIGPARVGPWVQVVDGLRPGDRLIAEDPRTVQAGQRIRVSGERRIGEK